MTVEQCTGCLLGLALGDAFGAPYEGGFVERLLWRFLGRTWKGERRWTDDTQMAIDVAQWLLESTGADPDALARRLALSYRWSRGYGAGASRVLKRIARGESWQVANRVLYREGSFGNGAATRAPVLGLVYAGLPQQTIEFAKISANITHAHPLGIEGAVLIAVATQYALEQHLMANLLEHALEICELTEFTTRIAVARDWQRNGESPSPADVAKKLGNLVSAPASCVTAIYLAVRFCESSFKEMIDFAVRIGGDVDTIGAMAGAIWGARRGRRNLPQDWIDQLESSDRIEAIGMALFERIAREKRG